MVLNTLPPPPVTGSKHLDPTLSPPDAYHFAKTKPKHLIFTWCPNFLFLVLCSIFGIFLYSLFKYLTFIQLPVLHW